MHEDTPYAWLRLTLLLFILGFSCVLAAGYFFLGWFVASDSPVPVMTTETISLEVREKVSDAQSAFWQDRDYDSSISMLTDKLDEVSSDPEQSALADEARLKNELASKYLRNEQEKAFELFAEVFNDERYPVEERAAALLNTMWHVSSHVGDSSLSSDVVNELVFAPERFGHALDIENAEGEAPTPLDVRAKTVAGFKKVLEMDGRTRTQIFASSFIARYAAHVAAGKAVASGGTTDQAAEIGEILGYAETSLAGVKTAMAGSEGRGEYLQYIGMTLYNLQRAYGFLYQMGQDTVGDIEQVNTLLVGYLTRFESESYLTNILLAEATMRFSCVLVEEGNYDAGQIDEEKIKSLLEHSYRLSSEDKERRRGIAIIANEPQHACYKPLIFIANTIDERLKSFLINDVGTWQASHFNQQ